MSTVPRRPEHVLLGVDFSAAGEAAKEHAASLCLTHGARLTLVHALEDTGGLPGPGRASRRLLRRYQDLASESLEAMRAELAQRLATVDVRLCHGARAHRLLVEAAAELHPDLIVVGTRGAGSVENIMLGSTARRLVQLSEQPVLAIPPGARAAPIHNVLLPTDFSRDAELASAAALPLLRARVRPTVTLLYAFAPPFVTGLEAPQSWPGYQQRVREDVRTNLKAASRILRLPDCPVQIAAIEGDPVEVILEQARLLDVDLIAMGTRGHDTVASPLLGSTTEKVLQKTDWPMLLVNRDRAELGEKRPDHPTCVAEPRRATTGIRR